MGLLDNFDLYGSEGFDSPQNQGMMVLAAGLLAAGGPSRVPISFGQALASGLQNGQNAYLSARDRKTQNDLREAELKLRQFQDLRQQTAFDQQQKWLARMSGGQPTQQQSQFAQPASAQQPMKMGFDGSGNASFQSQPDLKQSAPQGQTQPQAQSSWLANASLDDLTQGAAMGIPGMKEALDAKKFMLTGIKRENNTTYVEPNTGKQTYFADPTKGLDYNPETRTVTGINGFNQANAAMKGSETAAIEAAKAANDLVTLNLPSGPIQVTRAQALQMTQGQQVPQGYPQQPQAQPTQVQAPAQGLPQPMNPTQAELNGRSAQLRVNQPQMDNERLAILQQELANERDPNNRARLQREIAGASGQGQPAPQQQPQFAPQQAQPQRPSFGIPLQSEAQKAAELANVELQTKPLITQQVGAVTGKQGTTNALNENWIKQSYNPVLEAGKTSRDILSGLDALKTINVNTGWGTEAKANAANVLTSLGIAPKNAELYATNVQRFQSVAMGKLLDTLAAQKGPQTEGDSTRAQKTFVMLQNTPQANQFIADFARAKANIDARKAAFYQEALPIAQQTGDLNEIDRRWMKLQGSIWNDPVLQQYKTGAK